VERSLRFHPDARADLERLRDWIAAEAGIARAAGYLARIEEACQRLCRFPLMGFERRAAIVYRVTDATVDVLAVYHGGRDLRALSREW
jgi:plasmid stabilization system protein ParE